MPRNLATRHLAPEILDGLLPADERAIGSRRDLVWINRLMFQPAIMAWLLRRSLAMPPRRILEIGSGDGRFMLAVAARLGRHWPDVEVTLLDRAALGAGNLSDGFAAHGWTLRTVTGDVFEWLAASDARFDIVTANLFLHHFDDDQLVVLFQALQAISPIVVATEPHRNQLALGITRFLWVIGANDVTLHDAAASVVAGFRGRELSALWPSAPGTTLREGRFGPFTHVFAALADARGPAGDP